MVVDELALVRPGATSFLLQRFYVPEHGGNFMMHLLVENADGWYAQALAAYVVGRFGVRLDPSQDRQWRLRDFAFADPPEYRGGSATLAGGRLTPSRFPGLRA